MLQVVNAKAIARVLTANVTLLVCARLVHARKTVDIHNFDFVSKVRLISPVVIVSRLQM